MPTGLGDQAPLIAEGADAIAITAGGERPLRGDEDTLANFSPSTLGSIGRAALSLALALDAQRRRSSTGRRPTSRWPES